MVLSPQLWILFGYAFLYPSFLRIFHTVTHSGFTVFQYKKHTISVLIPSHPSTIAVSPVPFWLGYNEISRLLHMQIPNWKRLWTCLSYLLSVFSSFSILCLNQCPILNKEIDFFHSVGFPPCWFFVSCLAV